MKIIVLPKILSRNGLILRPLRITDAETITKCLQDGRIKHWTMRIPHPYHLKHAEGFIRNVQKGRRRKTNFTFGIVPDGEKQVVGAVSLMNVNAEHACAELGYWMSLPWQGCGLATEAVRLMLHFGFRRLKLFRIYASAFGPNLPSQRVLEKNGFTHEGTMRKAMIRGGKRCDLLNYGLLMGEYRKRI
ncbi:MAG: GNAT family N-acetyltransferase [Sedimentisphaerales bacterium]|nr:GNAT family N-acetyltransferase [Sedimentisphaerales bacterium]